MGCKDSFEEPGAIAGFGAVLGGFAEMCVLLLWGCGLLATAACEPKACMTASPGLEGARFGE